MSHEKLAEHRRVWQEKRVLREIYHRWYEAICSSCAGADRILEIGGGSGNLKEFCSDIITSDYIFCNWLDLNLDAHHLPFRAGSLNSIVAIDVLHHLQNPVLFLYEVRRALCAGGRLVLLEPFISPWSYPVYRFVHPEDVDFSFDVFSRTVPPGEKDPFDGNMAIATLLFSRKLDEFDRRFPDMPMIKRCYSDFLLYPLSGGFDHPSLVPEFFTGMVKFMEKIIKPFAGFFAFRMLIVLEKQYG